MNRGTAIPPDPLPEDEGLHASPVAPELVPWGRDELQAMVHELRNGLNSVLMNAGVLAAVCRDRPEMRRHIAQIESDGQRCAQCLQALSDRHLQ